jgi:hypothetical protein
MRRYVPLHREGIIDLAPPAVVVPYNFPPFVNCKGCRCRP